MTQTKSTENAIHDGISRCEHCAKVVEAQNLWTVGVYRLCQDCATDSEIRREYR